MMKAILIDSYNKEVRELELEDVSDERTLNQMYELIKCRCVDATAGIFDYIFQRPELGEDTLWFDDEGRLKAGEDEDGLLTGFQLPLCKPIAGNGLILGCDCEGASTSHNFTPEDIAELKDAIEWARVEPL